ncbi:MAG: glycosyltransferase family 2 protein, partial [Anaerolineae bacterium]|nr:glycosyltransferase family 2 protein [Anaerolineae bacterium]
MSAHKKTGLREGRFLDAEGKVSIIMPTYNHQYLIGKSIRSVLDQYYDNWELIIVDDESPDDTASAVKSFTDERIHYIRQDNKGLPGARNTGLSKATGNFIALLDGDDLIAPHYLKTLVKLLQENPDFDAVYCRAQFIDSRGNLLPQLSGRPVPPDKLYLQLLKANFLTPNCVLAYRRCYEAVGLFDTSI